MQQRKAPRYKVIDFEGDLIEIEDRSEPSSPVSPVEWRKIEDLPRPKYSDGTYFPANFLEHETVVGYTSDKWPKNEGVDDVLDIVTLFE